MKQREDETSIDFLRRVTSNLNCEQESLLTDLPTVQAVLDYAALWDVYGTDLMVGIEEAILDWGADPKPLKDFIAKYNLDWSTDWIEQAKKQAVA